MTEFAGLGAWTRPGQGAAGRRSRLLLGGAWVALVVAAAVVAGFGWLDLLREAGSLGAGPAVPDALPLRRLAGGAAQPLSRVLLAFLGTGLVAGLAVGRLSRPARAAVLFVGSGVLLPAASEFVYAIQETESLSRTVSTRHPGVGVVVEALLLALGAAAPPRRRRRGGGAHPGPRRTPGRLFSRRAGESGG